MSDENIEHIPEKFKPLRRSHEPFPIYNNLAKVKLTVDEKTWLCNEVTTNSTSPAWYDQLRTKKGLMKRYSLSDNFFKRNMPIFLNQHISFKTSVGPRKQLDDTSLLNIATQINERTKAIDSLPESELRRLYNEEAKASSVRNRKIDTAFEHADERTFKKFKKQQGIAASIPDMNTNARLTACQCPRMSFVWYLICWTLSKFLPGVCKWNADASTYVFQPKGKGDRACTLIPDKEMEQMLKGLDAEEDNNNPVVTNTRINIKTKSIQSGLAFAIKVMQLQNAGGEAGRATILVAIKDMPPDVFVVCEVKGLTWTNHIGGSGFVYFSKTRCGTKKMWEDWLLRVCFPDIKSSNEYHQSKVTLIFAYVNIRNMLSLFSYTQ